MKILVIARNKATKRIEEMIEYIEPFTKNNKFKNDVQEFINNYLYEGYDIQITKR